MIYIKDLIRKKKEGKELTEEEIKFFVYSYNREEILNEQVAALLTLMNINGLSLKEMSYLANEIAESGKKEDIYKISNKIIDIHPIGGMDDKITLILLAIISALELPALKILSREKSLEDKLVNSSIYNFNNQEKIKELIDENRIVLVDEQKEIAPTENKLYKLRNDIACNYDISIIAVNLMSLEIALGFRNAIFDISYGEKAYVKTLSDAQKLAKNLIKMGENFNKNIKCFITKLDEPVGKFFGNTLEVEEALNALQGNMLEDVKELVLEMGSNILLLVTGEKDLRKNKQKILEVIENGQAYRKLIELIPKEKLSHAENIVPIMSNREGYIENIDMSLIRGTAQYLNAIRYEESIKLDYGAGIEFCKKIGEKVKIGELLGYIYTNEETKIHRAVQNIKQAYLISDKKIKQKSRIIEVI